MQSFHEEQKAGLSLRVIVVGAGIGGLSVAYCLAKAGHQVTVLERKKEVREVGAGVWLTPNGSRLLRRWGLAQKLEEVGGKDRTEHNNFVHYTGKSTEVYTFGEAFEKEAGCPTYQLHRADLHGLLHEVASPIINLRFDCQVISVDVSELTPSVVLKNKETIQADLIIGADGVHSTIREALGNPQIPIPTNGCVHRVLLPAEVMMNDPELRPLIENSGVLSWIGPQGNSVVGYGIRGKTLYNLVVHVRGDMQDLFTPKGDPNVMREAFQDSDSPWDPRVHKLLSLVKSDYVLKWRMLQSEPLDRWVHVDGPITLLGDACHIFPPRYGQGANLAIEDAAVFGNLFSRITDRRQIKALLHAYEEIRRPRTTAMRLDVMERLARRSALRLSAEHHTKDVVRPLMMEHRKAHELTIPIHCSHDFGYDADEVVDIWWAEHGREVENLPCQT